jgi:hypothetical protein
MAGTELEKAFLEAAEIAKKLPKNLQEGMSRSVLNAPERRLG